jgi:hypothetical protein
MVNIVYENIENASRKAPNTKTKKPINSRHTESIFADKITASHQQKQMPLATLEAICRAECVRRGRRTRPPAAFGLLALNLAAF